MSTWDRVPAPAAPLAVRASQQPAEGTQLREELQKELVDS